jgi:hypothetical protein
VTRGTPPSLAAPDAKTLLAQVFHRENSLAIQRRHELQTGIHGFHFDFAIPQFTSDNGAGAAITFGAAFFGTGAMQVFAQVLEQGTGGRQMICLVNLSLEKITYQPRHENPV